MAEGRCAQCARFFLIVFNFIFWVSGGISLGTGIFLLVSDEVNKTLTALTDMNFLPLEVVYTAAHVMIGVGSFVFFVGFCGCCGAIRESAIMLGIYIACMSIVMIGEFGAGIYVAVEKGNIETSIKGELARSIRNYTGSGNSTIDFLQLKFQCCGSDNYTDYQTSFWILEHKNEEMQIKVPKTCCYGYGMDGSAHSIFSADYSLCNQEAQNENTAWDSFTALRPRGCYTSLLSWITGKSTILIAVGVAIGIIEIFGIIFAVCVCRNRSEYYD